MKKIILCRMLALMPFFVLPLQSSAQTNPTPPGTGPVTNCSNGCTVITCNATTCTVNYCDYSGCRVVGEYPRPTQPQNILGSTNPVAASSKHAPGSTLSPTDARLQLVTACSSANGDCRVYAVKPEGSSFVGTYYP